MIETNQISHFLWSHSGVIGCYLTSRLGLNLNRRTRIAAASSVAITLGIIKEVSDYISSYPYFTIGDTASDLTANSLGVIAGITTSYILSKSYRLVKGRTMSLGRRIFGRYNSNFRSYAKPLE